MNTPAMRLDAFKRAHATEITTLANELHVDLGIAGSIYVNAAMYGWVPAGESANVRAALYVVGDDAYWKRIGAEYMESVG